MLALQVAHGAHSRALQDMPGKDNFCNSIQPSWGTVATACLLVL